MEKIRSVKKTVGGLVALAFLWTNTAGLYAGEKDFWKERRENSVKFRSGEKAPNLLVASAGVSPTARQIASELPAVSAVMGKTVPASLPNARGTAIDEPSPNDWMKAVLPYGDVGDIYVSPKAGALTVVHIQDAHGIEDAQRNVSALVGVLEESRGINLVGLEGAAGTFALDTYRAYPAQNVKDVADFFLKKGLITGSEHAGLTLPKEPTLFGVEKGELYRGNVEALRAAYSLRPQSQVALDRLTLAAHGLKKKHYSKPLLDYDRHFQAYGARRENLGSYVRYLYGTCKVFNKTSPDVPNVRLLLNALEWEETLDFKAVEADRLRLVETLVQKLSHNDLQDLVNKSLAYRSGQMGYGDYHRNLRHVCTQNGVDIHRYGQVSSYINYVLLAEQIDRNHLIHELDTLERTAQDALVTTPEERRLVDLSRQLALLTKLFHHEMTMADWTKYQAVQSKMVLLPAELGLPDTVMPSLTPFEDFCRKAEMRNHALVENLLIKMTADKTDSAVLIAGGFHTEGLTALLRSKQISYVVLTPKIKEIPEHSDYMDVLAKDPVPLDKLIAGEKIYLVEVLGLQSRTGVEKLDKSREESTTELRQFLTNMLDMMGGRISEFRLSWETMVTRARQSRDQVVGVLNVGTSQFYKVHRGLTLRERITQKLASVQSWAEELSLGRYARETMFHAIPAGITLILYLAGESFTTVVMAVAVASVLFSLLFGQRHDLMNLAKKMKRSPTLVFLELALFGMAGCIVVVGLPMVAVSVFASPDLIAQIVSSLLSLLSASALATVGHAYYVQAIERAQKVPAARRTRIQAIVANRVLPTMKVYVEEQENAIAAAIGAAVFNMDLDPVRKTITQGYFREDRNKIRLLALLEARAIEISPNEACISAFNSMSLDDQSSVFRILNTNISGATYTEITAVVRDIGKGLSLSSLLDWFNGANRPDLFTSVFKPLTDRQLEEIEDTVLTARLSALRHTLLMESENESEKFDSMLKFVYAYLHNDFDLFTRPRVSPDVYKSFVFDATENPKSFYEKLGGRKRLLEMASRYQEFLDLSRDPAESLKDLECFLGSNFVNRHEESALRILQDRGGLDRADVFDLEKMKEIGVPHGTAMSGEEEAGLLSEITHLRAIYGKLWSSDWWEHTIREAASEEAFSLLWNLLESQTGPVFRPEESLYAVLRDSQLRVNKQALDLVERDYPSACQALGLPIREISEDAIVRSVFSRLFTMGVIRFEGSDEASSLVWDFSGKTYSNVESLPTVIRPLYFDEAAFSSFERDYRELLNSHKNLTGSSLFSNEHVSYDNILGFLQNVVKIGNSMPPQMKEGLMNGALSQFADSSDPWADFFLKYPPKDLCQAIANESGYSPRLRGLMDEYFHLSQETKVGLDTYGYIPYTEIQRLKGMFKNMPDAFWVDFEKHHRKGSIDREVSLYLQQIAEDSFPSVDRVSSVLSKQMGPYQSMELKAYLARQGTPGASGAMRWFLRFIGALGKESAPTDLRRIGQAEEVFMGVVRAFFFLIPALVSFATSGVPVTDFSSFLSGFLSFVSGTSAFDFWIGVASAQVGSMVVYHALHYFSGVVQADGKAPKRDWGISKKATETAMTAFLFAVPGLLSLWLMFQLGAGGVVVVLALTAYMLSTWWAAIRHGRADMAVSLGQRTEQKRVRAEVFISPVMRFFEGAKNYVSVMVTALFFPSNFRDDSSTEISEALRSFTHEIELESINGHNEVGYETQPPPSESPSVNPLRFKEHPIMFLSLLLFLWYLSFVRVMSSFQRTNQPDEHEDYSNRPGASGAMRRWLVSLGLLKKNWTPAHLFAIGAAEEMVWALFKPLFFLAPVLLAFAVSGVPVGLDAFVLGASPFQQVVYLVAGLASTFAGAGVYYLILHGLSGAVNPDGTADRRLRAVLGATWTGMTAGFGFSALGLLTIAPMIFTGGSVWLIVAIYVGTTALAAFQHGRKDVEIAQQSFTAFYSKPGAVAATEEAFRLASRRTISDALKEKPSRPAVFNYFRPSADQPGWDSVRNAAVLLMAGLLETMPLLKALRGPTAEEGRSDGVVIDVAALEGATPEKVAWSIARLRQAMKSEGKIHVVVTNSNALVDTKGTLASAAQAIPYFGEAFSSAVGSSSVHVVPWDARVFTPGAEGHLMDLDSLIKLSGIGDQNFTSIELLTNATVQTKRFADILIAVTSLEIEKLCTESFRAVLATRRSA